MCILYTFHILLISNLPLRNGHIFSTPQKPASSKRKVAWIKDDRRIVIPPKPRSNCYKKKGRAKISVIYRHIYIYIVEVKNWPDCCLNHARLCWTCDIFWKLASGTAWNSSFMEAIINVRILVNHFLVLDYVLKSWEVLLMFHKTLLTLSSPWWHLLVIVNLHNNSTKTTKHVN